MKKVLICAAAFIVFIALLLVPATCFANGATADGAQTADVSEPSQFYSWDMITTYSGCLALTILLTQFLKPLWPSRWKTQYLSYIAAFVLLNLANLITGNLSWSSFGLNFLNAIIISFAANGGYNNFKEAVDETETGDEPKGE